MENSTKIQIRNLLLVVFSSIIAALLFTGYLLYTYNPTGEYKVKNVLLSPDTLEKLRARGNILSDSIEYLYFDPQSKKTIQKNISPEAYAKLYQLIENDVGSPNGSDLAFNNPSKLVLYLQSGDAGTLSQEVDFSENSYRIKLREQSAQTPWVYFSREGILKKITVIVQGERL